MTTTKSGDQLVLRPEGTRILLDNIPISPGWLTSDLPDGAAIPINPDPQIGPNNPPPPNPFEDFNIDPDSPLFGMENVGNGDYSLFQGIPNPEIPDFNPDSPIFGIPPSFLGRRCAGRRE